MAKPAKLKEIILFGGDIVFLYLSLFTTLFIRYGSITEEVRLSHIRPFTILFIFWILIFYIIGFYEIKELKNTADFGKKFSLTILINFIIAIAVFYFIPGFGITPKTNLFIFLFIFGSAFYAWRTFYNNILIVKTPAKKILLIGGNKVAQDIVAHIKQNNQLGYEIKYWIKEGIKDKSFKNLSQIIKEHRINLIVVPAHIKKNSRAARLIYKNLLSEIEVINLSDMYENVFHKVPLAELEEVWFLENLAKSHKIHDAIKRPIELILSIILAITFLPFVVFIALFIKTTSSGSAFFSQVRVGKNGKHFILWKFRTMKTDAEKRGPRWSKPGDNRITYFGKFLRKSHLDELPQLWNILRGDISLVGPRPERPEFVQDLEKEIPYYELRHLVRPGLTGWAQINYKYGSSLDDAYEKLQYDIYYLKHRSLWLDFGIFFKTANRFFIQA